MVFHPSKCAKIRENFKPVAVRQHPLALRQQDCRSIPNSTTITRTIYFACHLPRKTADALNAESGRIYTLVKVEHYRVYRQTGHWLSQYSAMRLNDFYNGGSFLHAHSVDAAQEGFYKACKTAKANRGDGANYPHRNKPYRTTVWKNTGIRRDGDVLLLSLARGYKPLCVPLPEHLRDLPSDAFVEMRLVYNKSSRKYEWHLVVKQAAPLPKPPGSNVAAVDMGEIHPVTITDGIEAAVISCRQLRAQSQHTAKNLASIQQKQSQHQKGSRRWKRLQRRKNRFLAKQELRRRDIEHKLSHEVVKWCETHEVGTLAIGDVRDVADGKRMHRKGQQKIANWSHGKMRRFIKYKAEAVGIVVKDDVDEAYTSQTCAACGNRHKPKGRMYICPACGSVVHRDVQGSANILSRFLYDELAKVPVVEPKYRHPVLRGKRSSPGHGASSSVRPATP